MKKPLYLLLAAAAALTLLSCESLGTVSQIGTALGVATGNIDQSQAEAINKSAAAVQKSFEDITPEQEYYIGRAVGATVLSKYPPYQEQKVNDYLNLLGQTLALASDRPETFGGYHFLALDSEEINAFATPSGLIFVTRGLLRCAPNEEATAAILAHEIAHVVKRHGLQSIKKSRLTTALTSVALTAAQTAGPEELAKLTSTFQDSITDITSTLITSGYSRAFESEADLTATAILKRVGYDPWALVEMLKVMQRKLKPGGLDFAKTHPEPKDRILEVQKELAGSTPAASPAPERQKRYRAALGTL